MEIYAYTIVMVVLECILQKEENEREKSKSKGKCVNTKACTKVFVLNIGTAFLYPF